MPRSPSSIPGSNLGSNLPSMPSGSPTAVLPGLTAPISEPSRLDQAALVHQAQLEAAASIAAASAGVLANGVHSIGAVRTASSVASTDTTPVYTSTAPPTSLPTLTGSLTHTDGGLTNGLTDSAIDSKSFISTSAALNASNLLPSAYSSDFSAHTGLPTSLSWAAGWPQQAYYKQ